jgi:hypothetical protein
VKKKLTAIMCRVVVKIAELVARRRHPIEVAEDAVRKPVTPSPEQNRPDYRQREIGEDRERECHGNVIADAQLSAYLDFAQRPRNERAQSAQRDDLPKAPLLDRRHRQSVRDIGRVDADEERVPDTLQRRAIKNQRDAQRREQRRGHAEKADVKRSHPIVEKITPDQGASAHAIFSFEAQQCHVFVPRITRARSPGLPLEWMRETNPTSSDPSLAIDRAALSSRTAYAKSLLVITAEAFIGFGPSIQLKRLVLNRMK